MEVLSNVGIILQSGITGFQVYVLANLGNLKDRIKESKKDNNDFQQLTKKEIVELDRRIKKLELTASKYWSKYDYD